MAHPRSTDPDHWDWSDLRRRSLKLARRYVSSRVEAEEVAQEAIERAWRFRHHCRSPTRPAAWVLKITHREALRAHARDRDRPEIAHAEVPEPRDAPFVSTTERSGLAVVLEQLDVRDQGMIWLRYAEDLPTAEIAQRMGMAEATVRVRLHRLHRRLAEQLATNEPILSKDFPPA